MNGIEQKAFVKENISSASIYEQLAEECCELAQVAIKLSRHERKENPTSKSLNELIDNLIEETADVLLSLDVLGVTTVCKYEINSSKRAKLSRWVKRIEERNENGQSS